MRAEGLAPSELRLHPQAWKPGPRGAVVGHRLRTHRSRPLLSSTDMVPKGVRAWRTQGQTAGSRPSPPAAWEPPAGRQGELVPALRPWSVHRPGSVAVFMHNFQLFRAMRLSSESLALCTEQEFWKRFTSFPTKCRQTIRDLVFDSPFRSTSEARNRAGPLH